MLILASKSPRRRVLMKNAGYKFEIKVADVDESPFMTLPPKEACIKAALAKSKAVEGEVVVGSDTFVWFNGEILGKPKSEDEAFSMLSQLSENWHEVYTGVAIVSKEKTETFLDITRVKFRKLSEGEIRKYIKSGEPMDKAGSYGLHNYGASFAIRIEGDYQSTQGLPMAKLIETLRGFGIKPDPILAKKGVN